MSRIEWIDTTRQGTDAIGNLERRIRERRVTAIVVLEGLISPKRSDPLISAARQASIPHAYGGKGGARAITRGLAEIDGQLSAG